MYNLAVSYDENSWKAAKGHCDIGKDRVATEYTTNALQEKYKANLQALTENPTLFVYEHGNDAPAQVGWITKIEEKYAINLRTQCTRLSIKTKFVIGVSPSDGTSFQ